MKQDFFLPVNHYRQAKLVSVGMKIHAVFVKMQNVLVQQCFTHLAQESVFTAPKGRSGLNTNACVGPPESQPAVQ